MTPTIELDTTLADLYRDHGIPGNFLVTTHCVFGHLDLHPNFPRELVYPEDAEPVPFDDSDEPGKARLRNIILGLKPLRRAFGVGNLEVIFFAPNVDPQEVERDLRQLPVHQRHRVRIIGLDNTEDDTSVLDRIKQLAEGKKLVFWRPQGWMREVQCLVDPQLAFDINAKDYLLTAGIKTPPSEVVNVDHDTVFATRKLPFAVKLLRAGCGFGTYLVTSETRRAELLRALPLYKSRGTKQVILSEYVDDVRLDLSVHFFIGGPGDPRDHEDPLILGVSVQTLTADGKWVGGHIDYSAQDDLKNLVRDTVVDTARRLPRDFVGWAGVDILVDNKHPPEQWVVDLNARFTGSMPICLMRGHFWERRGLPLAQFAAFEYQGRSRDKVYQVLEEMIGTGQVVVTASARIGEGSYMVDVVWGGKDVEDLARVGDFIREALGGDVSLSE